MKKGNYTQDQENWLRINVMNKTYKNLVELTNAFNNVFGECRTKAAIQTKINKSMGMKLNTNNLFTEEEDKWLRENYRKYLMKELCQKHNDIFPERTEQSLTQYLFRQGLLMKLWTAEEENWVCKNYYEYESLEKLLDEFNRRFDRKRTLQGFSLHCQNVLKLKRYIPPTEEENSWLIENVDKYTYDELANEYNRIFQKDVSRSALESYIKRTLKLQKEDPKKFVSVPNPVGYKKKINGRTYVRVKELDYNLPSKNRGQSTFVPLAKVIWENHYGKKVPDDCQITFLNGNKDDFSIDNLYCIKKKYLFYMIQNHWFSTNPEVTLTAIKWCELMYATKEQ